MDNSKMLEYYLDQPRQLGHLFAESAERTDPFSRYWREKNPDRLYLIGSGTSYHAMSTVRVWLEAFLGVEVTVTSPTTLPVIRGSRPALIMVSQSGASTNTLLAAEKLGEYDLIALTGEAESPLHDMTAIQLDLGIGKETAGPKTIGYTASVLYMQMAALYAGKQSGVLNDDRFQKIYNAFSRAVASVRDNIARTEAWYVRNEKQLAAAKKYVVVGKGSAASVAGEGALKVLETVKVPASGYEFEEFLHGPILQIDKELAGIYYICSDADQIRMEALADLHATESPFVYKVYGSTQAVPTDPRDLPLVFTGEECTQGIELIYPCQLIGASLPQRRKETGGRNFLKEYAEVHKIKAYSK